MQWASQVGAGTKADRSFLGQLAYDRDIVYDLRCPDMSGEACYYILKVDPAKHDHFKTAMDQKLQFNMSDYGELLHFGRGEPHAELKAVLRATYGMYNEH